MTEPDSNRGSERDEETRIERILGEVLKQPTPEARARTLAEACGDDAALRAEVESLLAAHTEAGDFLEQSVEGETVETFAEGPGTVIGRYKLLEEIGEGGFGVVFMAEQIEPIQRKVALKIVKAGMDTREVIARFEAERQALALMDHSNIAKILDAGVTGAADPQPSTLSSQLSLGRPYFVMELVSGIPITKFCDQMSLSTTERLELFTKVCQAVQHAHQKGIIHRDLKPSNVLVTLHDGTPVPKVIDFGVAKALGQKLTDKTLFTGFLRMVGTPAYMSPEQADLGGLDIDTRSDIYSLGVLLYELLTGLTPFDADTLREAALDEMRRIIRETEPPRPSTRLRALGDKLTEVARRRQMEAPRLLHFLRGDLDWIVMKCLEKDRRRRYDTANMLALDVQRHLDNEPIVARPPSKVYRFQKLVRRNKLVFAAGSAVAAALILGLGLSTVALLREKAAREHGRRLLYASDMNSAFQAIADYDLAEAHRYLNRYWPKAGEPDLRGWEWRYLWQRCQSQELLTLGKHKGAVSSLAFSSDGHWLASGGDHGQVKIWDLSTHELVRNLTNGGTVVALAFSPDGSQLAAGCCHRLTLWDTRTWRKEDTIVLTNGIRVESLRYTPDGRRLVAMNNHDVGIWQVKPCLEQEDPLGRDLGTSPGQHACAISSNGRRLAYSTWARPNRGRAILRDLETGTTNLIWESKTLGLKTLALSPDGQTLALARNIGPVEIYDLRNLSNPGRNRTEPFTIESGEVYAMAFSGDGGLLALGGLNGRIELWDTAAWRKQQTLMGHLSWITDMAFSPDTNASLLATTSRDGTVRLWSTTGRKRGEFLPFEAAPDWRDPHWEKALYVDAETGTYTLWDIATGSRQASHPLPYAVSNLVGGNIGPGARRIAFTLRDPCVCLWDPAGNEGKGEESWRLPTQATVEKVYFSADGKRLFGSSSGRIWIWDVERGREIAFATNSWNAYYYQVPQFTPDRRQLAIPHGWRGDVCLWDFAGTGKFIPFEGRHPDCMSVALSPDGSMLAAGNYDGMIKVWDVASRKEICEFGGRGLRVLGLTFTPDGQRVVASHIDQITVWDVSTGSEVCTLPGDPPLGGFLAFQDPDTLIAGFTQGTRRLRAPSFEEIEATERMQNSECRMQK